MPLAKKINQMNIEYDRQRRSSVSPQNEKPPVQAAPVDSSPEFVAKYPFPQESPYYNSNLILSQLYLERIQRNPHLKHSPS